MPNLKLVIYTPISHATEIRQALANSGAGHIRNYDSCSFSVRGTGRFRPLKGSTPHVGTQYQIEEVEEERIEAICPQDRLDEVLKAIRAVHPYEEPAIDVYPLLDI